MYFVITGDFVISGFFIPGFHCKGAFINCERGEVI